MAKIEDNIEDKIEGPGKVLSIARDKAGLSVADISGQLNLSETVINQLESDDYAGDIPDAFIRGYLRTYARAVGADEEQIVALYSQAIGTSIVRNHFVPSVDVPPVKIQVGSHMLWFKVLSIVVVIVILGLGWMAYSQTNNDKKILDTPLPQSKALPEKIQTTVDLVAETLAEENENLEQQVVPVDISIEEDPIDNTLLENDTNAQLTFNFINDCWVKVVDSNDEVLAVGLKSAGRRFVVSGVPPFSVILGEPSAVSLQYNNQSVDMSLYPASQTARFTLGEDTLGVN